MVVKRVEEITVEFEAGSFCEMEALANTHVPVVDARLTQPVSRRGTVDAQRWLREAVKVYALKLLGEIVVNVAALSLVGALEECTKHTSKIIRRDAVWEPSLERSNAGCLPSTDEQFGSSVNVAAKFFSASDWQLIHVASDESLIDVEVRESVILFRMVVVLKALESRPRSAYARGRRLIIFALRPGIGRCRCQITCTMLELHVHAVVVGVAVPIAIDVDVDEVGIRQPARVAAGVRLEVDVSSADLLLAKREAIRRNWVGLCDVTSVQKMDRVSADVVHFERGVVCHLSLNSSGPRLNIGIQRVVRFNYSEERESGSRKWAQVGKRLE